MIVFSFVKLSRNALPILTPLQILKSNQEFLNCAPLVIVPPVLGSSHQLAIDLLQFDLGVAKHVDALVNSLELHGSGSPIVKVRQPEKFKNKNLKTNLKKLEKLKFEQNCCSRN